jgi:hypothetical protein
MVNAANLLLGGGIFASVYFDRAAALLEVYAPSTDRQAEKMAQN